MKIENFNIFDAEFIDVFYKTLPVNLSLLGFFSSFIFYNFRSKFLFNIKTSIIGKKVYYFLNRKWFFDKIYNEYFSQFFFKWGYSVSYKFIDRGMFAVLGPTGLSTVALKIGSNIHKMQTGYIFHYTLVILIGATLFFGLREVWLVFEFFIDYRLFIIIFMLSFFMVHPVENKS